MGIVTSEAGELLESRLANTALYPTTIPSKVQSQSIAKFVTTDDKARVFRITLARLDRQDGAAPAVNKVNGAELAFPDQGYPFAAADANGAGLPGASVPPRRSNPVFSINNPSNHALIFPILVQIAWGQSGSAQHRIIAQWPAMGASIVVEGSYVEVFFGGLVDSAGTPPIELGSLPKLSAMITPLGGTTPEASDELSLTQGGNIAPFFGAFGLLTDGVAHTIIPDELGGFISEDTTPSNAAVPCSTVFGVAPFVGWNATIRPINPFPVVPNPLTPTIQQVSLWPTQTVDIFDLTDNAVVDDTGTLLPTIGSVAIRYGTTNGTTTAKTVAQMEALVNTSALYKVTTPDTANAAKILFPGFSGAINYVPQDVGTPDIGEGFIAFPSQGAAFYVPDFARRVQVVATEADDRFGDLSFQFRVPLTGDPNIQLVWYDDTGSVIYGAYQGTQGGQSAPPVWHLVPAGAVLLGVYSDNTSDDPALTALVHWRIAP